MSRNGHIFSRFDVLADQLASVLEVEEAILDGEVIVADETGRPQFYDLLRGTRPPAYVAFDLLWLDGTDLRSLPLSERRQRLQTILPATSAAISEALSVEGRGGELFELIRAHDLEGSWRSVWPIRTIRASNGSRSRTRTTRRRRAGAASSTGLRSGAPQALDLTRDRPENLATWIAFPK